VAAGSMAVGAAMTTEKRAALSTTTKLKNRIVRIEVSQRVNLIVESVHSRRILRMCGGGSEKSRARGAFVPVRSGERVR
jgi:hypothetical protein